MYRLTAPPAAIDRESNYHSLTSKRAYFKHNYGSPTRSARSPVWGLNIAASMMFFSPDHNKGKPFLLVLRNVKAIIINISSIIKIPKFYNFVLCNASKGVCAKKI